MTRESDISEFQGEHRWLSNFWACRVCLDGVFYPSVENAYQAAKLPSVLRDQFKICTPGQAKRIARKSKPPQDWNAVRVQIMRDLLKQKFASGTTLGDKLRSTGAVQLVEGNSWGDTFWGVCRGVGENTLGKLLMEIRTELQRGGK